ncbi:MAG: RNA polymerase sigma factor [Deltaproteobacteria bacterium]|nr:RNA polymerase sigma factor [Deltaproteobacteria bacterium]
MINPFTKEYETDTTDPVLIQSAQTGSREALEELILRHQPWIYNIALRMLLNVHDAEDVTQEIIIKVITKLSTFKGKSSFRTWLYRIVANHVINMKKNNCEKKIMSFNEYGRQLNKTPEFELPDKNSVPVDIHILIEEAKIGCMTGMLLCLNRDQRIAFILGELFNISDSIGSEILKITKNNFRKRLSRARKNLYGFMNEKCGLIKPDNPCQCAKKTAAWIRSNLVDPKSLKFNKLNLKKIKDISENKSKRLENLLDNKCAELFRDHPFHDPPDFVKSFRQMIENKQFQEIICLSDDRVD